MNNSTFNGARKFYSIRGKRNVCVISQFGNCFGVLQTRETSQREITIGRSQIALTATANKCRICFQKADRKSKIEI